MNKPYHCILAIVDSVAEWEIVVRRAAVMARGGSHLLVIMLYDHHGGFESDHVPLLTPSEFLQRTEADLQVRLNQWLDRYGTPHARFKLLNGFSQQESVAWLAAWSPDMILATDATAAKIQGGGGFLGLMSLLQSPCSVRILSTTVHSRLHNWWAFLRTCFVD